MRLVLPVQRACHYEYLAIWRNYLINSRDAAGGVAQGQSPDTSRTRRFPSAHLSCKVFFVCIDGRPRARVTSKKKYQAPFAFHGTIEKRKRFGDAAVCSMRLDENRAASRRLPRGKLKRFMIYREQLDIADNVGIIEKRTVSIELLFTSWKRNNAVCD